MARPDEVLMTLYTKGIHAGPQSIITHVAVTASAERLVDTEGRYESRKPGSINDAGPLTALSNTL